VDTLIRLDRAYPGDVILAADSGTLDNSLSNYYNVMFQIEYNEHGWREHSFADARLFDYDSVPSQITVIDAHHTSVTLPYTHLHRWADKLLSDSTIQMLFTFSALDTLLAGMTAPYSLLSRIYLVAKTSPHVSNPPSVPQFYFPGHYPLVPQAEFRANLFSNHNDTDNSCDPWTADFTMLQPSVVVYINDPSLGNCAEFTEGVALRATSALWPQDDFPYEFRPFASLDNSTEIQFPSGYTYLSSQLAVVQPNYNLSGNNHFALNDAVSQNYYSFPASVVGNTLTYTQCLPLLDCKAGGVFDWPYYQIQPLFQPSCNAPDTGHFYAYTGYTTSIQQSNPTYLGHVYDTLHTYIIHQEPRLSLSLTTSTNMCSDSEKFLITLTNSSIFPATYPWIALKQTVSHDPPVIFSSVTGASYYNSYGDSNLFIMLPPIPPGATFTVTAYAFIDTSHGYGCVSSQWNYPVTVLAGNVCTNTPPIAQPSPTTCQQDSTTYIFSLFPSTLTLVQDITTIQSQSCSTNATFYMTLIDASQNGLSKPVFYFDMPASVALDSIHFGDFPNIYSFYKDDLGDVTGNLSWNLTADSVLKNGFTGVCGLIRVNSLNAMIYVHTVCGFTGISQNFNAYSTALSPCGQHVYSDTVNMSLGLPPVSPSCCMPIPACIPVGNHFDTIFYNQSATALARALSSNTFECKKILIEGTFTVDTSFYFGGCDVSLAPHALIDVVNNSLFQVNVGLCYPGCSHLHAACDTMWRGVFVHPGSTFLTSDETLIEDADTAVYAINSGATQGLYNLSVSTFNKNYRNVVVSRCSGRYYGTSTGCLYTSRNFDSIIASASCVDPQMYYGNWGNAPVDTLLAPHTGQIPSMGWDIGYVDTISDGKNYSIYYNAGGFNTFDNLHTGIYSLNTNMSIYSDFFNAIDTDGIDAISDEVDNLIVGGPRSLYLNNAFMNCINGVFVKGSVAHAGFKKINISDNQFHFDKNISPSYGIYLKGEMSATPVSIITIDSNTMDSLTVGVYCSMNRFTRAQIDSNSITGASLCSNQFGVVIEELGFSPDFYSVKNNTIQNLHYGIYVNDAGYDTVYKNNVLLTGDTGCMFPFAQGKGIYVTSGTDAQIVDNTVDMHDYTNPSDYSPINFAGIDVEMSPDCYMTCNTTKYVTTDIRFSGASDVNFNVWGNKMTAGHNTANSVGDRLLNSVALGGQFRGSFVHPLPSDNEWVDTNNFRCKSYVVPFTNPLLSIFYVRSGSTFNPDGGVCSPQIITFPDDTETVYSCANIPPVIHFALLDSIAETKITYSEYPDTTIILAKQALTSVIWNNPSLLSDSILNAFNDSISGTTLGEIMAADTEVLNGDGITAFEYYCIFYLTPASNIEANIQLVGQIILNTRFSGATTLTSTELAALYILANKCPYMDGIAVYQARTLLDYYTGTVNIYDEGCVSHGTGHAPIKQQKKEQVENAISFNIYPNPNNGSFTLEYNLGNETNGKFEIYNEIGMDVGEYLLSSSSGTLSITTQNLGQGLYFYKVFTDTGIKKVGKIVIMR